MKKKRIVSVPQNASAMVLIANVYRAIPTKAERDMWHEHCKGKEKDFVGAKAAGERMGFTFRIAAPIF